MQHESFTPGESDYADHLLGTAAYFMRRCRWATACRLLEIAEHTPLSERQEDELDALAERLLTGVRAARGATQGRPCRLLSFRPRRRPTSPSADGSVVAASPAERSTSAALGTT